MLEPNPESGVKLYFPRRAASNTHHSHAPNLPPRRNDNSNSNSAMRTEPNIIITGTPGVGKTCHCTLLASSTGLKHLSINQIVKERECHEGWDEAFQSWIVDEDKVSSKMTA
jgi:Cdc6-like AAA superfamily ATPase